MILVGVGEAEHDSSICAYINGKIKYLKYERESGVKHGIAPSFWYFDTMKRWGIDLDKIDALCFTDRGRSVSQFEYRLPLHGEKYLQLSSDQNGWQDVWVKSNQNFLLDHHYAHFMSNTNSTSKSKGVILDGWGSGKMSELVVNGIMYDLFRSDNRSPGWLLINIGLLMGLKITPPMHDATDIAGKIMGLQAYGVPDNNFAYKFKSFVPHRHNDILDWIETLKLNWSPENQEALNILATMFKVGYSSVESYFKQFKNEKVIYSGGVALNVNWNRWLLDEGYDLEIQPHVYDGGLSIGCLRFLLERFDIEVNFDNFPYIQDDEAPDTIPSDETIQRVAELLANGKVVGWYQGHGEIGPRALGNRSILMNPSIKDGKDILNQKVKHREWWRPFGASVKQDKAHEYFDLHESPYMLYSAQVLKSGLDAITHVDGTCRHQTVTPEQNEIFYKLLDAFDDKTGLPVLLNTSLNLGGKPIAGTMAEAIELFQTSEMDALCLGNHLLLK